MMPPIHLNRRPTTPRAKNTALTVIADGAPSEGSDEPRRTIEPARRATNHVCREDANALTATNGVRSAHTGDFQGKGSTNKEICLISPAF
jgi:hypothetical protein